MATAIQFPNGITDEVFEWLYCNVGWREEEWTATRAGIYIDDTLWYVPTITINDDQIATLFTLRWK